MILSIGHSNHPIERLVQLLQQHGVTVLADVRSVPYSRFNPQFNRKPLEASLADAGIRYVFLGDELGARTNDPSCYEGDRVSYKKLAASEAFRTGLAKLRAEGEHNAVAMMCAEREPLDCHRTILIARELARKGEPVTHILADGSLEPHERTEDRLLAVQGLANDLFADRAALVDAAYDARAAKLAYVRRSGTSN